MKNPFNCEGCKRRRVALTDWIKGGVLTDFSRRPRLADSVIEVRALARFLQNPGATESAWHAAPEEVRISYREAVKADL